jgi:protein CLEC16A
MLTHHTHSLLDYILSNNRINELIDYDFDFDDEDLLAHYISFLKTLALKLDVNTVQFFFNVRQQQVTDFDCSRGGA